MRNDSEHYMYSNENAFYHTNTQNNMTYNKSQHHDSMIQFTNTHNNSISNMKSIHQNTNNQSKFHPGNYRDTLVSNNQDNSHNFNDSYQNNELGLLNVIN